MLLWADDLDDLVVAAGQLLEGYGHRLLGLAGLATAGLSGVAIGIGLGALWG
jgi:hypothetical protein